MWRWTSSTNSTSPSPRFVRIAARSLGRSRAGPLVGWNPAPIALATIWASVVLPSPGGPLNSRWSTALPSAGAVDQQLQLFLDSVLADEVGSEGRPQRDVELAVAGSMTAASITRSSSTLSAHLLQRLTEQVVDLAPVAVDVTGRLGGLLRREPERDERLAHVDDRPGLAGSSASPPSRSRRSTTTRWATLFPTPGTTVSASASPAITARRNESALIADRNESPTFRPTPVTPMSGSKSSRSSVVENPYSVIESSRTTMRVCTRRTSRPPAGDSPPRSAPRRRTPRRPPPAPRSSHPCARAALEERDHRAAPRAASRSRRRRGASSATAAASTASGFEGRPRNPCTRSSASRTCRLSASRPRSRRS